MSNIAPFDTEFAHGVVSEKYMQPHGETHWHQTADRAVHYPMQALADHTGQLFHEYEREVRTLVRDRHFMPGGRYLYAAGNDLHQVQNCLLLNCEDSREGWADLSWKTEMALLTGAGIGVYWGNVRPSGSLVKRTGGIASGPVPKMIATNEQGRAAVQGGNRRAAIWAGLPWWHKDVFWFMEVKNWPDYLKAAKAVDAGIPAPMDMTNISVCLDDEFFQAFEGLTEYGWGVLQNRLGATAPDGGTWHDWARKVYWTAIDNMTQRGEPGFSVDLGDKRDEKLRNACTEIVSADDSDICNLGGLVLPRFDNVRDFEHAVRMGVLYLTAGTVYSDVPYQKVAEIREKNRRLGLDLIGVHEFLLQRGVRYGSDEAFEVMEPFMAVYDRALEFAHDWQDKYKLSHSVAATSGAPTGTRGIAAESTTGWEPVTAAASKRVVVTSRADARGDERTTYYILDPTVSRLLRDGMLFPSDPIEDSFSLAHDYERRFKMQAYAQSHTDQAISMTINLPAPMTNIKDRQTFGETLYKYLPQLRGITVYPNGAISGQPITPCSVEEVLASKTVQVAEDEDKCLTGTCGI